MRTFWKVLSITLMVALLASFLASYTYMNKKEYLLKARCFWISSFVSQPWARSNSSWTPLIKNGVLECRSLGLGKIGTEFLYCVCFIAAKLSSRIRAASSTSAFPMFNGGDIRITLP
jgi:hypothetical protein